jgi:hypothetical protein
MGLMSSSSNDALQSHLASLLEEARADLPGSLSRPKRNQALTTKADDLS